MIVLLAMSLVGCGKKADENKPMDEVQAEAEQMNVDQLRAKAIAYKDAIMAKKADIEKLADKLQDIPLTGAVGEEAQGLRADIDALNQSVSNLKARFNVYYNKLKEMGGDTSGLEL